MKHAIFSVRPRGLEIDFLGTMSIFMCRESWQRPELIADRMHRETETSDKVLMILHLVHFHTACLHSCVHFSLHRIFFCGDTYVSLPEGPTLEVLEDIRT